MDCDIEQPKNDMPVQYHAGFLEIVRSKDRIH